MELILDTGDAKFGFFDPYALLRVVTNIARNARQAMMTGGRFFMSATGGGEQPLKLVLKDNGPGVPEALRARLLIYLQPTVRRMAPVSVWQSSSELLMNIRAQ